MTVYLRYVLLILPRLHVNSEQSLPRSSQIRLHSFKTAASSPPMVQEVGTYCHHDDIMSNEIVTDFIQIDGAKLNVKSIDPVGFDSFEYGKCMSDSDCKVFKHSSRRFCIDGICRECRPSSIASDCGHPSAHCSEATGYTCSSCSMDEDCPGKEICRFHIDASKYYTKHALPRKSCSSCPHDSKDSMLPIEAAITNSTTCDWQCPSHLSRIESGTSSGTSHTTCGVCPMCKDGEYLGSERSSKKWFNSCSESINPKCFSCGAIASTFCANLIFNPRETIHNDNLLDLLDLGPAHPCRYFTCKAGWYADRNIRKCKKCHLHNMCGEGMELVNCGGASPGECVPVQRPRTATMTT